MKMIGIREWSILCVLLFAGSAFAHGNHRLVWQNSESIIQSFKNVSKCTERIWPGYTWAGQSFLSYNKKSEKQVAYSVDTNEVFRISLKDLENSDSVQAPYSKFVSKGQQWISVNEDFNRWVPGEQMTFALGAHETFHFVGQKPWVYRSGGSRGTPIPLQWQPRYYRALLQDNLKKAFLTKQSTELENYLGKAKYWYDQWKENFPNEVASTTDGYEGTAEYAELISVALALKGCQADESHLENYVLEQVVSRPQFADLLQLSGHSQLDSEGYNIGGLAALLLRWHRPVPEWQSRVAQGETPVDILLEGLQPQKEERSVKEAERFIEAKDSGQKRIDAMLGETFRILDSPNYLMISIPQAWKSGATSFQGFFTDTERSLSYGVIAQDLSFENSSNVLKANSGIVLVSAETFPCNEGGWSFAILESEAKQIGDKFEIRNPKISGISKGVFKTDSRNQKWLCFGE